MQPMWIVTAVDAVAKKIAFVRQVAGELGLSNLRPRHDRVERLNGQDFDVVTSRAFGTLLDLTSRTRHLLRPGGTWVAMKGKPPGTEGANLPGGVQVFHVEPLHVPGVRAERCLVWMREAATA
jgi:16S rRNA (guanine527-N7)-methyltransferase